MVIALQDQKNLLKKIGQPAFQALPEIEQFAKLPPGAFAPGGIVGQHHPDGGVYRALHFPGSQCRAEHNLQDLAFTAAMPSSCPIKEVREGSVQPEYIRELLTRLFADSQSMHFTVFYADGRPTHRKRAIHSPSTPPVRMRPKSSSAGKRYRPGRQRPQEQEGKTSCTWPCWCSARSR